MRYKLIKKSYFVYNHIGFYFIWQEHNSLERSVDAVDRCHPFPIRLFVDKNLNSSILRNKVNKKGRTAHYEIL